MIILITLLFQYQTLWGQMSPIVRCLAQEEMRIHKNYELQHHFKLNQELINAFSAANEVQIKASLRPNICKDHVALALLKILLIEGESIFEKNSSLTKTGDYSQKTSIFSLLEKSPRLFFQHILSLQSEIKIAGCLEKEIPELKKLIEQFQFLQVEISRKQLLQNKEMLKTIFRKLETFPAIQRKCQAKTNL